MRLTRITGVFVVTALALGIAACGDEEQDAQTREELTQAANTICDKYEKRIADIEEPGNIRNTEQAAAFFDEAAPVIEAEVIDFKALDPDDDTKDEWNAFVAKQEELRKSAQSIADKAIKGDRSYINDLSEFSSIDDDANDLARQVGANGCARD